MPELEDLRNRSLIWQIDARHKGRCAIYDGAQEIGHVQQESWWRGSYDASLAGLSWKLQYAAPPFRTALRIDFADGKRGLAETFKTNRGLGATVDGVTPFRFERDDGPRGVWRDSDGFVAVSIGEQANESLRSDWIRHGAIRAFEVCAVPHAPTLILLGLVEVLFNGFFIHQSYVPIDFSQG